MSSGCCKSAVGPTKYYCFPNESFSHHFVLCFKIKENGDNNKKQNELKQSLKNT